MYKGKWSPQKGEQKQFQKDFMENKENVFYLNKIKELL